MSLPRRHSSAWRAQLQAQRRAFHRDAVQHAHGGLRGLLGAVLDERAACVQGRGPGGRQQVAADDAAERLEQQTDVPLLEEAREATHGDAALLGRGRMPGCCIRPGCIMPGCCIRPGCIMPGCIMPGCIRPGCIMPGCIMPGCIMRFCIIPPCIPVFCIMPGCIIPGCIMPGCTMPG